ncbi:hypothetical protein ACGFYT_22415 [Streptomyces sp. NPDC048208]|uniref:hypothetical protein n=1 Tax=Streptomyces sp. NPDC048208 TaxID=3365515 RepID=UPI0037216DBD
MKGRIALSAATGLVVIGVLSANADHHGGDGGTGGSGDAGKEASATAGSESGRRSGGRGSASGGTESGAAEAALPGDGDFRVGSDIEPGTYRSTGDADGSCHWERTKAAGRGLGPVIADDDTTGTAVVTIRPTDAYFKSTGCGGWKKTG